MQVDVQVKYAKAGGPPKNWWALTIMLDGVEVKNVVELNAVEGWIECYRKTKDGRVVLGLDGSPTTERRYGQVLCFYTTEIPNSAK